MYGSKPHCGGQKTQHQRGSYRPQNHQSANQDTGYKNQATNHDTGYKSHQESHQGRAKSANETQSNKQEVSKLPNQNSSNKAGSSGSQSAEVKTCVVNPFVPLQVLTWQLYLFRATVNKRNAKYRRLSGKILEIESIPSILVMFLIYWNHSLG